MFLNHTGRYVVGWINLFSSEESLSLQRKGFFSLSTWAICNLTTLGEQTLQWVWTPNVWSKNAQSENTTTFQPELRTSPLCEISAHYNTQWTRLGHDNNVQPGPSQRPAWPLTTSSLAPHNVQPGPSQRPAWPLTTSSPAPHNVQPGPSQRPARPLTTSSPAPHNVQPGPSQRPAWPLTMSSPAPHNVQPGPSQRPARPLTTFFSASSSCTTPLTSSVEW